MHEKTAGTNANTETIDSWAKTIRNEYGRNYSGSAGFRSRGTTDRVVAVDDGEQNSDPVGYSWNNYGYSSHEELIEAIKSGTMIMDENGDLITFDDGDGVSYQQRSTDGLSNRAILANVLSEVAQDDKEASMLKLYTDNVQRLDEQIVRLAVINAEIKQKSFAKGKRDTARLAELKTEQSAIQKEVVKYDKMLLDLETTAPLKRPFKQSFKT